jgi:hypothetical protein
VYSTKIKIVTEIYGSEYRERINLNHLEVYQDFTSERKCGWSIRKNKIEGA